jgi:hypothetical protein
VYVGGTATSITPRQAASYSSMDLAIAQPLRKMVTAQSLLTVACVAQCASPPPRSRRGGARA